MNTYKRNIVSPFKEYAKFCATGLINTSIDFLILNSLLFFITTTPKEATYISFKTLSFLGAVIFSYFLNRTWVFAHQTKNKTVNFKESSKFLVVSVIGLLVNVGISYLIFSAFANTNIAHPVLGANIAALLATFCTMLWNFTGYKFFVFNNPISQRII